MKKVRDFSRAKIKKIATDYANLDLKYSHTFFEREYEISEAVFYSIIRKAIVESIVDEQTVKRISKKAAQNSQDKVGEKAGMRTKKHQEYLALKRKVFKFPKKEARAIAYSYSESELTKQEFCKKNEITTKLFDQALVESIVNNWIDDIAVELLKNKALKNHESSSKIIDMFEELNKQRQINKKRRG